MELVISVLSFQDMPIQMYYVFKWSILSRKYYSDYSLTVFMFFVLLYLIKYVYVISSKRNQDWKSIVQYGDALHQFGE